MTARARRLVAAVALAAGLAACTAAPPAAAPTSPVPLPEPVPAPAEPAVADVVELVAPSVVTVRTPDGLGSGVVYRADIVITNQHVVGDTTDVMIEFADGSASPGTVLAGDAVSDLAVVRTARAGLPVPEYRTELPRVGEPVIAIGSPLGFEGTVTAGIVSALDREIPGSAAQSRALVDLIQVDAAISPGNSGGALLDAQGRVVGINEAYIPPAAGAVSLGFAIPAATAVSVADQLLADGTATHPYLGVSVGRLTPQIREALDVGAAQGVLVRAVEPGGPAGSAGVRQGDVLLELAGSDTGSLEELFGALRDTAPGQQVDLVVLRAGERLPLPVTIGAEPGA
jgi:S1-C subfamily serine protease